MPKLARAIHFDTSDEQIFSCCATTGEWCISGGFEFSDWAEADLQGKARQAFANGWMGVGTFGRVTFVAIAQIEEAELREVTGVLAQHLLDEYGAPSHEVALDAARGEVAFMQELCDGHDPNTLLAVQREMTENGVHESFRAITPKEADISQLAVHGSIDP